VKITPTASVTGEKEPLGEKSVENGEDVLTRSSSPDSTFSAESSSTMATEFTQTSSFSVDQIQDATQILVYILQDDKMLIPLYESARNNPDIGVKKLRRRVRQNIKSYAENLRNEATDYLSFSASRLVRARAHYTARCIASEENHKQRQQLPESHFHQIIRDAEESSEDDQQEQSGQEREFADLAAFHSFLTGSAAFATFRAEM